MRITRSLLSRSGHLFAAFAAACLLTAAVVGYAHYRSDVLWFEQGMLEEDRALRASVDGSTELYMKIQGDHRPHSAPSPGWFRSRLLLRLLEDNALGRARTIRWFDLPLTKDVALDESAVALLESYLSDPVPRQRVYWHRANDQVVFRVITPYLEGRAPCAECVEDHVQRRGNRVTGAFLSDAPAREFLADALLDAILLAVTLFSVSTFAGLMYFRAQHQRHLSEIASLTSAESERRARELDENRRLLQTVIDQLPARINVKDRNRRYILVNKLQAEEFGCKPEEALGKVRSDFSRDDLLPASSEAVHDNIQDRDEAVLSGAAILNQEEVWKRRDGLAEYTLSNKAPLFDANGSVIGVLTVAMDITTQKRTEQMLRDVMRTAEEANRMKSEFLANMSHELRTPLNAVIGFSEIIKEAMFGPIAAQYRDYAKDIHDSGTHLLKLINDLLDLSKIEAGRMELKLQPCSIDEIFATCHRMIAEPARRNGVELNIAVQPDMPLVTADRVRLQQILLNLLSNAVKFTQRGKVWLRASAQSGELTISVEDTGIGMRPEDIPSAFEPFRQLDGSLGRRYEGTGLGLPLARKLAELHGGALHLTSQRGKGTKASVTIPLVRKDKRVA